MKKNKILAVIIMFALVVSAITVPQKAGATSKTQDEAIAWVNSQLGNGLDYDGVYGAQCVDLICYYYQFLGAKSPGGNGKDYATNALPSGWTRVQGGAPQKGDILVYGASSGNQYGHVAIYESDRVTYHQNFNSHGYVEKVTNITYNKFTNPYWGYIRPNWGSGSTTPSANVSFADFNQNGVWDTNAEMYIKVMNPSRANVTAVGCYLYNEAGTLIKSYSEACSFTSSYVNYNCNINNDMQITLTPGTTYNFVLFSIVNGVEYRDTMRSFHTTGSSDTEPPVITDVEVYDICETGYKVRCKASDNVGVVRVQFPTWTVANDQDDIQPDWGTNPAASGTLIDGYWVYEVKIADHSNETGTYATHIYAYDQADNKISVGAPVVDIQKAGTPTPGENGSDSIATTQPNVTAGPNATTKPGATTVPTTNSNVQSTAVPSATPTSKPDQSWKKELLRSFLAPAKTPKKITKVKVKNSKKCKMVITWKWLSADGIQVQYAMNRSFTKKKKTISMDYATSFKTIKGLKKNKTYYVRVRAYNEKRGAKKYGKWSAVKKVKIRK